MKPTDVPNGAVVRGRGGKTVLLDFDDSGSPELKGTELEPMEPWPDGVPANVVVLVHSVKGEKAMLLKSLATVLVATKDGRPAVAADLERRGELLPFVAELRKAYIERAEAGEERAKK